MTRYRLYRNNNNAAIIKQFQINSITRFYPDRRW